MNDNTNHFSVGDRVALKNNSNVYGVVGHVGEVVGADGVWIGVDWDDAGRGKHDGCLRGVRYFIARAQSSASFVRPDVLSGGTDLVDEIVKKYVHGDVDETEAEDDRWELIEMGKVNEKQRDFLNLQCIVLTNTLVTHVRQGFAEQFPHCFELDLTGVMLNKWRSLFEILSLFPKLRTFHFGFTNIERLDDLTLCAKLRLPPIAEISFNGAHLDNDMANMITAIFAHLREIYLAFNRLTTYRPMSECANLSSVDLQHNCIVRLSQVSALYRLPSLTFLNLSNCGLEDIEIPEGNTIFPVLNTLIIADNPISKWKCVSELARLPNLRKLVLRGSKLAGVAGVDVRELIIAKIPNLLDLDRCDISPIARRSAELYLLSRLSSGSCNPEHLPTIDRLKKIYKVDESDEGQIAPKSDSIRINLIYKDKSLQRCLPLALSIHRLVGLASKIFDFDPDDIAGVELRHKGFPAETFRRTKDFLLRQFDLEDDDFISFFEEED